MLELAVRPQPYPKIRGPNDMPGNRYASRTLFAIAMALAFVAGSGTATAADERWECQADKNLITLTANPTYGSGTLTFGGIVENAHFEIKSFQRRWSWNLDQTTNVYTNLFIISNNSTGLYYDISTLPALAERRMLLNKRKYLMHQIRWYVRAGAVGSHIVEYNALMSQLAEVDYSLDLNSNNIVHSTPQKQFACHRR